MCKPLPRIALLLGCMLALGTGCSKSENSEVERVEKDIPPTSAAKENDADNEEKDEEESSVVGGLLARGSSLGQQAIDKAIDKGSDTLKSATDVVSATLNDGRSWSENSLSDLRAASLAMVKASGDKLDVARDGVNAAVGAIASASIPDTDKIERIVVLMIPVIGPSRRYLDARSLYAEGKSESNPDKIARARRETLIACAEAGLDVGTLGLLGGGVDLVATGADKILGILKIGRTVNILSGSDSDVLTSYLDGLLEKEQVRNAVDAALEVG
ncbi:MAG: hypothetical protein JKY56_21815 [Kofleriaceae bacterium]|nr:hypothetical protein [Kofleriaceae bacterium]